MENKFVRCKQDVDDYIEDVSKKFPKSVWKYFSISFACEVCGNTSTKQLRSYLKRPSLVCLKKHVPDRDEQVYFNCESCGKETHIRRQLFNKKEKKLCKACQQTENDGGIEAKHARYLRMSEKAQQTQLERYGAIGNANPSANEKRINTVRRKYGDDFYSKMWKGIHGRRSPEKVNDANNKRKVTNLSKYGRCSTGFINARFEIDGIQLDSKYEFYFYVYCRDHSILVVREPIGIKYFMSDCSEHTYYPDFRIPCGLVETKSDYYLRQTPQEKIDAMLQNNVFLIDNAKIKLFKNYVDSTYGKDYCLAFKIT